METLVSLRGNARFPTGIQSFLYEDTGVSLWETDIIIKALEINSLSRAYWQKRTKWSNGRATAVITTTVFVKYDIA